VLKVKEEMFPRAIYHVLNTFLILHVPPYPGGRRSAQSSPVYAARSSMHHCPVAFLAGGLPPVGLTLQKIPPSVRVLNRPGSIRLTTTLNPSFIAANPFSHSQRLRLTIPVSLFFFGIISKITTSCNPSSLSTNILATVSVLPPATSQES
jgi:hypothetical protein